MIAGFTAEPTLAASPTVPLIVVLTILTVVAVTSATTAVMVMRSRHRRRLGDAQRAHEAELAAQKASAATAITHSQQQEAMAVNALEAERIGRSEDIAVLLNKLTQGMKWEQVSREIIRKEAVALGIDGVLVTNLCLLTRDEDDAAFIAQIDHLLITAEAIVVIEAKYWEGVVFDDVNPASIHPALTPVSAAMNLPRSFAIHLQSDKDTLVKVALRDSPRTQARKQALHLSSALKTSLSEVPWIQTCVLYSHPRVQLFSHNSEPPRSPRYTPALDTGSLSPYLRKAFQRPSDKENDARSIARLLEPYAADVVGLGKMSEEWPNYWASPQTGLVSRVDLDA